MLPFKQIQAIQAGYKDRFMYACEADQGGLRNGELLRMSGPAIFLDRISGNGRKYIAESVHTQVAELQPRIAKKALFGVLDHPPTDDLNKLAYVKMTDVSHRIDALWYNEKEKTYYVTVTILDTPNGRILKAIHDAGSPLYVSLRSLLDPSRNIQRDGYVDAYMLALITIDFVSRPGFADAELKAVDVSNESALAVCESLNLFKSNRIFDMKNNKQKRTRRYIPVISMESFVGVATQPTKDFEAVVADFLSEIFDKLPAEFTTDDFVQAFPDSMFKGHIIGLYEDCKALMITDVDTKTCAIVELASDIDGKYKLTDSADIQYFNTEIADNSNSVQSGTEMYPVISTEGYEPSDEFMQTVQSVLTVLQTDYADGFTQDDFNAEIGDRLAKDFKVAARIANDDDKDVLKLVSEDGEDGAVIELSKDGDVYKAVQITEYWEPGTESVEIGQYVKLINASDEVIAAGEVTAVGKYADLKDTIESEDTTGYQLMQDANVSEDTDVIKIGDNWYYVEDGMSVECDTSAVVATENQCIVITDANGDEVVSGELVQQGTFAELKDTIADEDPQGYANMLASSIDDDTEVYKVDDCWYFKSDDVNVEITDIEEGNENLDGFQQQTDGNQPDRKPLDSKYVKTSDMQEAENVKVEIVDDEDDAAKQNKEAATQQMYTIVEDEAAKIIDEDEKPEDKEPEDEKPKDEKPKDKKPEDKEPEDDVNLGELAEEAQRIFNMPNTKFAGNFAIEHMPMHYKAVWAGLSDAAKATIAKQALSQNIATEAQSLSFWSNTNFVAVERACLINKGKVEAALESMHIEDPKTAFMKRIFNK